MAVELARKCGYRKVGGLYLVAEGIGMSCDRLPIPLTACPTCGEEPRPNRGIAAFDPFGMWGQHWIEDQEHDNVLCPEDTCPVCRPSGKQFLMWVGDEYTSESFRAEAGSMGVSKRVHSVPKDLVLNESWVFLAKRKIIPGNGQTWLPGEPEERRGYGSGVFHAFRPQRLEKIVTDQTSQEELDALEAQGIMPVAVPHDDPDHAARKRSPQTVAAS